MDASFGQLGAQRPHAMKGPRLDRAQGPAEPRGDLLLSEAVLGQA
jgi:hypothetical protein